jgi:hypothetical protein
MLMNFDEPDSNVACSRRRTSNTPLQALNLLNDPVFYEAAQAFAWRIEHLRGSPGERIASAFDMCLARPPKAPEQQRLERLAAEAGWLAVARTLLNLDEFLTRE